MYIISVTPFFWVTKVFVRINILCHLDKKYTTKKQFTFFDRKAARRNQWRNSIRRKKREGAKKAGSPWIKDRKSVSEQKKKAQRAERIPERKKSNWDDGEFLDDWDEVSGKTAAHSNKRRVKKPAGKSSQSFS